MLEKLSNLDNLFEVAVQNKYQSLDKPTTISPILTETKVETKQEISSDEEDLMLFKK